GLIDGMNVSALISLDNVMSMAVPDEAIVDAQGKSYIFAVTNTSTEQQANITHFERIEVVKGTADMGYTAITPVRTLDEANQIAVKGAFFINAVLSGTAGHSH